MEKVQVIAIESADESDAAAVHGLLKEFAAYEKVPHHFHAQVEQLREAMAGRNPRLSVELVRVDGKLAGCAISYETFSTFRGRPGLFIEDLYVRPEYRGLGLGRSLMALLARRCAENNYALLHWRVLAWNQPAVRFYQALGADLTSSHMQAALGGAALAALARAN